MIVDLAGGQVSHRIAAAPGRHFYGHGQFTADGARLLCSENDYASGSGVIGVYDAPTATGVSVSCPATASAPRDQVAGRRPDAGDRQRRHPHPPRSAAVKSNLASMRPNLAYVDVASGRLLQRHEPERRWHQLSIRHIDVSPDDRVAVAMQFEGRLPSFSAADRHTTSGAADAAVERAGRRVQRRLRNYCGSVTFDADGLRFAVSSPRGGLVTFWSTGVTTLVCTSRPTHAASAERLAAGRIRGQ